MLPLSEDQVTIETARPNVQAESSTSLRRMSSMIVWMAPKTLASNAGLISGTGARSAKTPQTPFSIIVLFAFAETGKVKNGKSFEICQA